MISGHIESFFFQGNSKIESCVCLSAHKMFIRNQYTHNLVFFYSDRWENTCTCRNVTLVPTGCNQCTKKHTEWKWNLNIFILQCCRLGVCVLNHLHWCWMETRRVCVLHTYAEWSTFSSLSPRCNDLLVALRKAFAIPPSFSFPSSPWWAEPSLHHQLHHNVL